MGEYVVLSQLNRNVCQLIIKTDQSDYDIRLEVNQLKIDLQKLNMAMVELCQLQRETNVHLEKFTCLNN